jgi:hypothetical protein
MGELKDSAETTAAFETLAVSSVYRDTPQITAGIESYADRIGAIAQGLAAGNAFEVYKSTVVQPVAEVLFNSQTYPLGRSVEDAAP